MSYVRRVGVEFYGDASGYIAAANRVLYGTNRMGQGFRQGGRDVGAMGNQVKALGTTIRYALAGSVVFGVTAAVSRLADFKKSLGEIDSLAAQMENGRLKGFGRDLDDLGTSAILSSNKIGIATSDVMAYMTRFWSAFEPPKGMSIKGFLPEAQGFTDTVSKMQMIFGAEAGNPQELAGAIAGYVNQIPGGREHPAATAQRVAGLASVLTQRTPTITGRNVALDIGRMGAAQVQANMTPEQLFAVWTLAGRAGGSGSVIGRGLSQLLGTSLLRPTTPLQKSTYLGMGLPTDPTQLRSMGGMKVLATMLEAIGTNPKLANVARVLSSEEVDTDAALAAAETSGVDLTRVYGAFGRQESARQFIALLAQGGVPALKDFIKEMETGEDVFRERYKLVEKELAMQRIGQQWQNLNTGLLRGLEPVLTRVLEPPLKTISDFVTKHPTATAVGVGGAATLAVSRLLNRVGLFNKLHTSVAAAEQIAGGSPLTGRWRALRGVSRLLSGASTAQRAAVETALMTEATPNVVAGGAADGSRANPLWVIIHPYSDFVGVKGGAPSGGGGGPGIPPVVAGGRVPSWALRGGAAAAAAYGGYYLGNRLTGGQYSGKEGWGEAWGDLKRMFGGTEDWVSPIANNKTNSWIAAMGMAQKQNERSFMQNLYGKADVTVTTKITDASGKQIGESKKQAPVQLWNPGNVFPSSFGKPGTKSGGGG